MTRASYFYIAANSVGLCLYIYFVWSIEHDMKIEERTASDFGDGLIFLYTDLPVFLVCLVLNIVWGVQGFVRFFRFRDDRLGMSWAFAVLVWVSTIFFLPYIL